MRHERRGERGAIAHGSGQRCLEGACVEVTPGCVGRQGLQQHGFEEPVDLFTELSDGPRGLRFSLAPIGAFPEGEAAREHFVENARRGPKIDAFVRVFPVHFRRVVGRGAHCCFIAQSVLEVGLAEIDELRLELILSRIDEEHVTW